MANNSIFELADKFGYQSPFGDWLPKQEKPKETPQIRNIDVTAGEAITIPPNAKTMKAAYKVLPISVLISTKGVIGKVNVEVSGGKWSVMPFGIDNYLVSHLHLRINDLQNFSQSFSLKVMAYDIDSEKVVDTKTKIVYWKSDGKKGRFWVEPNSIDKVDPIIQISSNLYTFIKEFEGLKKIIVNADGSETIIPYGSLEGGAQTIGWGHKIKGTENFTQGITQSDAEILLVGDVRTEGVEKFLNLKGDKKITVPLNDNERESLISAVFNNGYGSTLAAAINKGAEYYKAHPESIYKAFLTRIYINNKTISDGLIKRRAREADLFLYNQWSSYPSLKFPTEQSYISAYKEFLKTGVLPFLVILSSLLFSACGVKDTLQVDKIRGKYTCYAYQFEEMGSLPVIDSAKTMFGQIIEYTEDGFFLNREICLTNQESTLHKVPISDVLWTKSQIVGQDTILSDLHNYKTPDSVLLLPFNVKGNENTIFFLLNNDIVLKKEANADRFCYFFFRKPNS
jgi:GH24 family phage-related lysozyme (muramidase)